MTNFTYSISAILALALIGCGSSPEGEFVATECPAGTEGCECYPNATCNDGLQCLSELCVENEQPGTGGNAGEPSYETGGTEDTGGAGTGGTDNTGGSEENTGGTNETGGTSGAETGGAGTGGSVVCTPKTCLTIAVELAETADPVPEACGVLEDGCGNYIDCGGCDLGYCGGGSLDNNLQEADDGVEGLCGGGCEAVWSQGEIRRCSDDRYLIQCSRDTYDAPTQRISGRALDNCTKIDFFQWCCDQV